MKQIENFYMGSLRNNEDYGFHTLVIKAIIIYRLLMKGQPIR